MDNSLFEAYKGIGRSYYSIRVSPGQLFSERNGRNMCRGFIKRHFSKGSKANAIALPYQKEYDQEGKHCHTVALYLMGLSLSNMFCDRLKDKMHEFISDLRAWYDFKYTWFLTCLYHDAASCIERGADIDLPDSIDDFFAARSIMNFPEERECVPFRFSREIKAAYYLYRRASRELEHGITAGYMLYDKLVQNFRDKTKSAQWYHDEWMDAKYLYWRRSHIDHFAYIADAIMCHNIWLCTSEADRKKYMEFGLEELIVINENKKLSVEDYPLQFMLCLLDTIEPIKKFYMLPTKRILENISLTIIDANTLQLQWTELIKKQRVFYRWLDSIYSMQEWMKVEISSCKRSGDECGLCIRIL